MITQGKNAFMRLYRIILFILIIILTFVLFNSIISNKIPNRFTNKLSSMDFEDFVKEYSEQVFRKPTGLEYKGKPIVLYGCSFAYGEKLKVKDAFAYQLSEYVKRPVYNYAIPGHCIQHMLFFLRDKEHYNNFPEPEYIIYTYIPAHLGRMNHTNYFGNTAYLQYEVRKNHLVQVNSPFKFLHTTLLHNIFQEVKYDKYFDKDKTKRFAKLKLYFEEARSAFQEVYPNTKFVILLYDYTYIDTNIMWNELEKEGFIIYKVSELAGIDPADDKYKLPQELDKWRHPNKLAWQIIVPKLSEALNLK